jgi:hypothetical protein
MFEQLQRWGVVIFAAGGVVLNWGAGNGDVLPIAIGAAVTLAGIFFTVYRHWCNLGWVAAIVGGSMILFGTSQKSSFLGQPIETPNVPLIVAGAMLAIGGLIFFSRFYSACYRQIPG